jgi:hypothetical protein
MLLIVAVKRKLRLTPGFPEPMEGVEQGANKSNAHENKKETDWTDVRPIAFSEAEIRPA